MVQLNFNFNSSKVISAIPGYYLLPFLDHVLLLEHISVDNQNRIDDHHYTVPSYRHLPHQNSSHIPSYTPQVHNLMILSHCNPTDIEITTPKTSK